MIDLEELSQLLLNLLCESCEILHSFSSRPSLCWKGENNPVTEVNIGLFSLTSYYKSTSSRESNTNTLTPSPSSPRRTSPHKQPCTSRNRTSLNCWSFAGRKSPPLYLRRPNFLGSSRLRRFAFGLTLLIAHRGLSTAACIRLQC